MQWGKKNKVRWASASEVWGEELEEGDEQLRRVEMSCWTVKLSLPALLEEDVNNDWNKSIILHTVYKLASPHTWKSHKCSTLTTPREITLLLECNRSALPKTGGSSVHPCQRSKMKSEIERISQFHNFLYSENGLLTSFRLNKWLYWFSEGQNVFSIVFTILSLHCFT